MSRLRGMLTGVLNNRITVHDGHAWHMLPTKTSSMTTSHPMLLGCSKHAHAYPDMR